MNNGEKLAKVCKILFLVIVICVITTIAISIMNGNGLFDKEDTRENFHYNNGAIEYITPKSPIPLVAYEVFAISSIVLSVVLCVLLIILVFIRPTAEIFTKWLLIPIILIITTGFIFVKILLTIGFVNFYPDSPFEDENSPQFYEFSSGNKRIVICEKSDLELGEGKIYQVYDDKTAWEIGSLSIDGKNSGDYKLDWSNKGIKITYNNGGMTEDEISSEFFKWIDKNNININKKNKVD
jgi:uncharacterized membrane protein YphA (DoxX/SURF4 family)